MGSNTRSPGLGQSLTSLLTAGALLCASSTPVAALSCLQMTPEIAISTLRAKGITPRAFIGTLTFHTVFGHTRTMEAAQSAPEQIWSSTATLKGTDFNTGEIIRTSVHVERSCLSVWCGATFDYPEGLILLEAAETGLKISLQPCAESVFPTPKTESRAPLLACLRGETCAPTFD